MTTALRTESPIEARLGAALQAHIAEQYAEPPPEIRLESQVEIGPYRVDFLITEITPKDWGSIPREVISRVVVECDGHEWHDRTKEQAARDRRRDCELLCAGYPVVRFTGSQIYNEAWLCAEDAFAALVSIVRLQAWGLDYA